jgi:hypothetical protein
MSTPREMQAGVPQGSVLSPTLYSLYMNDDPQSPGVHLAPSLMTLVYIVQNAKKAMFSESCSAASLQWSRGVSDGT